MVTIVKFREFRSQEFFPGFVGFFHVGFYHMGFCYVGFCHVGFCHVGFWHVGFCQNWEIEVDVTYRTCCIFYIDPSGFTFLKITNFCKKFTLELIKILDPFKYPIGSDFVYFQSCTLYFHKTIKNPRTQFWNFALVLVHVELFRTVRFLGWSLETLIPHFNLGTFYYLWSFEVALE